MTDQSESKEAGFPGFMGADALGRRRAVFSLPATIVGGTMSAALRTPGRCPSLNAPVLGCARQNRMSAMQAKFILVIFESYGESGARLGFLRGRKEGEACSNFRDLRG
jgi:hypothetical protein